MAASAKKAARTKKRKAAAKNAAGRKAATTRKRAAAGRKAATTRKRGAAGRKAVATRKGRGAGRAAATSYKPAGYTSVAPYLIVAGASATIDFLKQVFDASELRRFAEPGGKLMHAEVRIGDTVVMMGDAGEGWPSAPAHVHVYVSDVDATYARALAAGATSVQEPVQKQDEDKRGGVKDAAGTTWWMATRVG
jgi:PhnB protein